MMENYQVRFGGGPMEKCPNRQLASGLPYEMSWARWMTPMDDETTREGWLLSAIDHMTVSLFPAFKQPKWRLICGWPKGIRGGKHAVGQCRSATN
jgi:hypothetical protein